MCVYVHVHAYVSAACTHIQLRLLVPLLVPLLLLSYPPAYHKPTAEAAGPSADEAADIMALVALNLSRDQQLEHEVQQAAGKAGRKQQQQVGGVLWVYAHIARLLVTSISFIMVMCCGKLLQTPQLPFSCMLLPELLRQGTTYYVGCGLHRPACYTESDTVTQVV